MPANTGKMKGIDEFTQIMKNPGNSPLLSSQGFLSVFPIRQNQSPQKPDGFLLREGKGNYVRVPLA